MLDKIREILSQYVEVSADKIVPEADLITDLGLNSLDVLNIILEFEDEFGIEIDENDIDQLTTVGDIAEYIEARK